MNAVYNKRNNTLPQDQGSGRTGGLVHQQPSQSEKKKRYTMWPEYHDVNQTKERLTSWIQA